MLVSFLENISLTKKSDKWFWKWFPNHSYTVKACYNFLMHGSIVSHVANIIWKLPIPEKCKVFNWICINNKMLTADILAKKGMTGPSRCSLCYSNEETADHLFTNCQFSKAVWNSSRSACNIKDMPMNLINLWTNWQSTHRLLKFLKASDILAAITCCTLWKERNNRIFRSGKDNSTTGWRNPTKSFWWMSSRIFFRVWMMSEIARAHPASSMHSKFGRGSVFVTTASPTPC